MTRRVLVGSLLVSIAATASAYLPPSSLVLRRMAQKRDQTNVFSMDARGTLTLSGESAQRAAAASGWPMTGDVWTAPAVVAVKAPGRCRLEAIPASIPAVDRPLVSIRGDRVTGRRGFDAIPAPRALVEGLCTLLAHRGSAGYAAERSLSQRLAQRGVSLGEVAFGRLGDRVAWIVGGRASSTRPQAWVDKQSLQPLRLLASLGGAPRDLRLLEFGSSVAGDAFPRIVEVWLGETLEVRFTVERFNKSAKLSDSSF